MKLVFRSFVAEGSGMEMEMEMGKLATRPRLKRLSVTRLLCFNCFSAGTISNDSVLKT